MSDLEPKVVSERAGAGDSLESFGRSYLDANSGSVAGDMRDLLSFASGGPGAQIVRDYSAVHGLAILLGSSPCNATFIQQIPHSAVAFRTSEFDVERTINIRNQNGTMREPSEALRVFDLQNAVLRCLDLRNRPVVAVEDTTIKLSVPGTTLHYSLTDQSGRLKELDILEEEAKNIAAQRETLLAGLCRNLEQGLSRHVNPSAAVDGAYITVSADGGSKIATVAWLSYDYHMGRNYVESPQHISYLLDYHLEKIAEVNGSKLLCELDDDIESSICHYPDGGLSFWWKELTPFLLGTFDSERRSRTREQLLRIFEAQRTAVSVITGVGAEVNFVKDCIVDLSVPDHRCRYDLRQADGEIKSLAIIQDELAPMARLQVARMEDFRSEVRKTIEFGGGTEIVFRPEVSIVQFVKSGYGFRVFTNGCSTNGNVALPFDKSQSLEAYDYCHPREVIFARVKAELSRCE